MSQVRESAVVPLAPEAAHRLWTDTRRWATFIDGFERVLERPQEWPEPGSKLVWETRPGGRGRVTEKVLEHHPPTRLVARVHEKALTGDQVVSFSEDAEGTLVQIVLDYRLASEGPLRAIANALFIRRAIRDSLSRTLARFETEAAEEAELGER